MGRMQNMYADGHAAATVAIMNVRKSPMLWVFQKKTFVVELLGSAAPQTYEDYDRDLRMDWVPISGRWISPDNCPKRQWLESHGHKKPKFERRRPFCDKINGGRIKFLRRERPSGTGGLQLGDSI